MPPAVVVGVPDPGGGQFSGSYAMHGPASDPPDPPDAPEPSGGGSSPSQPWAIAATTATAPTARATFHSVRSTPASLTARAGPPTFCQRRGRYQMPRTMAAMTSTRTGSEYGRLA